MRIAACIAVATLLAAAGAEAAPRWATLSDCAAAYQANARIADPDRPASMTAQISDVADDYAKAAVAARRRAIPSSAAAARRAVAARMAKTAARDSALPRAAVEKIIDACPQVES